MKKILCVIVIATLIICMLNLVACNPKKVVRNKRSSGPKPFSYSYEFPYITDDTKTTSSNNKPSRSFIEASSSNSPLSPSLSTAKGVINAIDNIGEVTKENYLSLEQRILFVQKCYDELSPDQQLLVINRDALTEAKNKFDEFLAQDNVGAKQSFIDKINALPPFEYSNDYKQKINEATDCYNLIHDIHKKDVAKEYDALLSIHKKLFDYDCAEKILVLYNNLPSVITNQTVGAYRKLLRDYNNLTSTQKSIISQDIQKDINNFAKEIAISYQTLYRTVFAKNISDSIFEVNAVIGSTSSSYSYDGEALNVGAICDRTSKIAIFAPYGGEATIYLKGNENLKLFLYQGSSMIQTINATEDKITIYLDNIATYSITFSGDTEVFAIEFN